MRTTIGIVMLLSILSGCASPMPMGGIYWEGKIPIDSESGIASKTGRACMTSILSLVATGDASIDAAKINGNISQVSSVDFEAKNILGIYGTHCTIVRGN